MDEHVQRPVASGLRSRGVDVLTVQEVGVAGLADDAILDRATSLDRVVFTQDDDFLREANRRQRLGVSFAGVIYVHQRQLSIGHQVNRLELIAKRNEPADLSSRVEYL